MVVLRSRGSGASSCCCFRQGLVVTFVLFGGLLLVAYQLAWVYWLPGILVEDQFQTADGRLVKRRDPNKMVKRHQDKTIPVTPFDGVLEGHLTLVGIDIPQETGLVRGSGLGYAGVQAKFCHISWNKQENKPWEVPLFKDLVQDSFLCRGTEHTVDLWETARAAEQFDIRNHTFAATSPLHSQGSADPRLVVFHQSKCGSTLVANTLAALGRVYSEPPALIAALLACEQHAVCDSEVQIQLVQDVFMLMGRTAKPINMFYKIQSVGVRAIEVLRKAMPTTPWMFLYRDGVEILMSQFHPYQRRENIGPDFIPPCLRGRSKATQHPLLLDVLAARNRTLDTITREDYCAAHVASLAQAALHHGESLRNQSSTMHGVIHPSDEPTNNHYAVAKHWFVNYNQLPHILWERIVSELLVGGVTAQQREKMHRISKVYSKSKDDESHWKEDSTLKSGLAPPTVKSAAEVFLDPLYEQMEVLRVK